MYVHVNNVISVRDEYVGLCSRCNRNISASSYCHTRIFLRLFLHAKMKNKKEKKP